MPKIKITTKPPYVDMTPMVDLFAVILIFLMLTTTFRISEPGAVDTPYSISERPVLDFNIMTVVISDDGRVFFNVDNGPDTILKFRQKVLAEMGGHYGIEFTQEELIKFGNFPASIGVPIERMREFLAIDNPVEKAAYQRGVPLDSADNQLAMWVLYTRQVNPAVNACIKGDSGVEFPIVKQVLDVLQDRNVNKFNLITSLRSADVKLDEIPE